MCKYNCKYTVHFYVNQIHPFNNENHMHFMYFPKPISNNHKKEPLPFSIMFHASNAFIKSPSYANGFMKYLLSKCTYHTTQYKRSHYNITGNIVNLYTQCIHIFNHYPSHMQYETYPITIA